MSIVKHTIKSNNKKIIKKVNLDSVLYGLLLTQEYRN